MEVGNVSPGERSERDAGRAISKKWPVLLMLLGIGLLFYFVTLVKL